MFLDRLEECDQFQALTETITTLWASIDLTKIINSSSLEVNRDRLAFEVDQLSVIGFLVVITYDDSCKFHGSPSYCMSSILESHGTLNVTGHILR